MFLFLVMIMILVVGCGAEMRGPNNIVDIDAVEESIAPPLISTGESEVEVVPVVQSRIPFDLAAKYFSELEALFAADGGDIWGISLSVPFVFLDPVTRDIVANRPDPQGLLVRQGEVYAGVLPEENWAGYGVQGFGGEYWAILPWEWAEFRAYDKHDRLRVMSHLAFHRTQRDIFDGAFLWGNHHMDNPVARQNVIMETHALITALESTGEAQLLAIADALAIREERRRLFPEGASAEALYELHEGVTTYTELRLNYDDMSEIIQILHDAAYRMKILPSISWNFAYWTGAAYAFLLNEFDPTWKDYVDITSDLGLKLQEAAEITPSVFAEIDLNMYGYAKIQAYDNADENSDIWLLRNTLATILMQPTLQVSMVNTHIAGVPSQYFEIAGMGTLYGAGVTFEGSFGYITVTDGFFFAFHDLGSAWFSVDGLVVNCGRFYSTNGWQLHLNEGYDFEQERPWEWSNFIITRR